MCEQNTRVRFESKIFRRLSTLSVDGYRWFHLATVHRAVIGFVSTVTLKSVVLRFETSPAAPWFRRTRFWLRFRTDVSDRRHSDKTSNTVARPLNPSGTRLKRSLSPVTPCHPSPTTPPPCTPQIPGGKSRGFYFAGFIFYDYCLILGFGFSRKAGALTRSACLRHSAIIVCTF